MSTAEQPYQQQVGIQNNSDGEININQSQVNIAGRDMHIHMSGSAQERELHHLTARLTAFRLLDSHWIEEMQGLEQNLRFYEGFRATWPDLIRGLDVGRDQFSELLELATKSAGHRALIAIISEMGSGKTTTLKRLALELYFAGSIVLYRKETASDLSSDEIHQLSEELKHENISLPIYLCIDDAARVTKLAEFVSQLAEEGIKAVILLASRTSDWREANLALTANLDYDPIEFRLSERLSSREVEELSSKLHLHGHHFKPLKFDSKKSILVTMMEATGGRGFREIIRVRIRHLRQKGGVVLSAYEYTCLLGQFGLPMPISVLEALFPRNDLLADVLSQPLFGEVVQYIEDSGQFTAGHELVSKSVIQQQYGTRPISRVVLVEMFTRLIRSIPSNLSLLTVNLLLGLGQQDRKLAGEVISRSDQLLTELIQKSSADEVSAGWAKVYETAGDFIAAQNCHLKALELAENSHILARYAWFLRNRFLFIEARRYLERATSVASDDAVAHSMLGRMLVLMLLYAEAAIEFESALRIRPLYLSILVPVYLPILIYLTRYERAEELCRAYLLIISQRAPEQNLMWQISLVWILLLRNDMLVAENEAKVLADSYPHGLPKVDKVLTGRFRRKLYLSNEKVVVIQTFLDRFLPNVELSNNTLDPSFPDGLSGDATASVNTTSSIAHLILSSDANTADEEPVSKPKPLISPLVIETTVKQLRESGRLEMIPEYLDGIIQQDAGKWNTSAHLEYAKYLEEQGKLTDAEDHLINAVVYRNPESSRTLLQYACFLVKYSRTEEARNYFQHALATPKHRSKEFAKGAADYVLELIFSNNLQEAITICEQYVVSLSDDQKMIVVDLLMGCSRYEYLERFVRTQLPNALNPNKGEMAAALIIAFVRQGRYQETLPYQQLIKKPSVLNIKKARALAECAVYLARQHVSPNSYSQFVNIAMSHAPDNPYVLSAQTELLIVARKFTNASQVLEQLLSSSPAFGLAYALQGQLLSWQGNTHQAYSAFEQTIVVKKPDSESLAKYCNFLIEESRLLADVDAYESAVLLNLALEQGEAAYQLEATNPYVSNNYAHALSLAGELEQADTVVQSMLKRSPNDAFTLIHAGKIKASLSQTSDAINYYETAILVASPFFQTRAHEDLGKFLLSLGDPMGAYAHLKKALELSKFGALARLNMAELLIAIGRLDLAEVQLRQAVARNPGFAQARLRLADLLVAMDQIAQAVVVSATLVIEYWETGRLLAAVRAGHISLQLLNSLLKDKLLMVVVTTGLLAGRAASLNPYTQQTANRILQEVSNWLTVHPKTREFLETQITDFTILLQPSKIADGGGTFVANSHEKALIQFLRSYLKTFTTN